MKLVIYESSMDGRLVCKAPARCHQHPFNNVHTVELTALLLLLLGVLHASSEIVRNGRAFVFIVEHKEPEEEDGPEKKRKKGKSQ